MNVERSRVRERARAAVLVVVFSTTAVLLTPWPGHASVGERAGQQVVATFAVRNANVVYSRKIRFSGNVVDKRLGAPVVGQPIDLVRGSETVASTVTDAQGDYSFNVEAVANSTYSVTIEGTTLSRKVAVRKGFPVPLNVTRPHRGVAQIDGFVITPGRDEVRVQVKPDRGVWRDLGSFTVDRNGAFSALFKTVVGHHPYRLKVGDSPHVNGATSHHLGIIGQRVHPR